VAEVPLTPIAVGAFRNQLSLAAPGDWLFPSSRTEGQHYKSAKGIWRAALRKAGFRILGFTISVRRTLRVSAPAVLPMNGSSNCCDKGTPTYSKSIHRWSWRWSVKPSRCRTAEPTKRRFARRKQLPFTGVLVQF